MTNVEFLFHKHCTRKYKSIKNIKNLRCSSVYACDTLQILARQREAHWAMSLQQEQNVRPPPYPLCRTGDDSHLVLAFGRQRLADTVFWGSLVYRDSPQTSRVTRNPCVETP